MTQQSTHAPNSGDMLPKPYAKMARAVRPGLVHAVRNAVLTGDAPAAKYFYRAVAGPDAARRLSEKNALAQLREWLVQEP